MPLPVVTLGALWAGAATPYPLPLGTISVSLVIWALRKHKQVNMNNRVVSPLRISPPVGREIYPGAKLGDPSGKSGWGEDSPSCEGGWGIHPVFARVGR